MHYRYPLNKHLLIGLLILFLGGPGVVFADGYEAAATALVQGDQQQAFRLFKRLARQGHVQAQYQLGLLYLSGEGVEQDQVQGIEWLKQAAQSGDYLATNELGQIYMTGRGVAVNEAEAIHWVELAGKIAAQNQGVAEDGCE